MGMLEGCQPELQRPQRCTEQSCHQGRTPSPALSIFNSFTGIPFYKVLWSPSWHQQPQITVPVFCEIRGNTTGNDWQCVSSLLSVLQCATPPTNLSLSFFSESYRDFILKTVFQGYKGLAWTTPPGTVAQDSLSYPKWTWITNSFLSRNIFKSLNIFKNFKNLSLPMNTILCHKLGSQAFESLFSLPFQGAHYFPEVWDPLPDIELSQPDISSADGIRRVTPGWT